ncbi:hypothetical protein ACIBQ1_17050 [Nonomuraea sp. NPDC050153]
MTEPASVPLDLTPAMIEPLGRQALDLVIRQVAALPDAPASDYRVPLEY